VRPDGPVLRSVSAALLKLGYQRFEEPTDRMVMFLRASARPVVLQKGPYLRLGEVFDEFRRKEVDIAGFLSVFEFLTDAPPSA
jgi:hypothetical protein